MFGRPKNPYNKEYATGGACGGDAGMVASQSTGLALSVDMNGDARYPASSCGVACFKPTSTRMSSFGIPSPTKYSPVVKPVLSPMARSVKDITHLLKCLWDSKLTETYFDRSLSQLGFNASLWSEDQKKPLRIGFYFDDGFHDCSHSSRQALLLVKTSLEDQGHTLIDFTWPSMRELLETYLAIEGSAGGLRDYTEKALQGERVVEEREGMVE